MMARRGIFSSEAVTEGHPDKVCDQISDSILDACLARDPMSRVACETLAKSWITLAGEITSNAGFSRSDYRDIARDVIKRIGYNDASYGKPLHRVRVLVDIVTQSPDIAQGVNEGDNHEQGAGDQGMMFGYACDETPAFMPLPISLAHGLISRLTQVRKDGTLPYLGPDGKSQISFDYDRNCIHTVVLSTQHSPDVKKEQLEDDLKRLVIRPVCGEYLESDFGPYVRMFINPTGRFVSGGPMADAGLTGRKIIVDTYGGSAPHGGGAFSGKDPTKVDRSAAYAARYIAKNIVAAGLARECKVQLAYAIGVANPVSLHVETDGAFNVELSDFVAKHFPVKPRDIIEKLNLRQPMYARTASGGHFGCDEFPWERVDKVPMLKEYAGERSVAK